MMVSFSMSVFKACFEHALVNRPPSDECFSGVPGHGEGHAGLADIARVVIGARPHIHCNNKKHLHVLLCDTCVLKETRIHMFMFKHTCFK